MSQTACGRKCGNIVGRAWSGHVGPRSDQSDLVVVDAEYWGGGGERGYVFRAEKRSAQASAHPLSQAQGGLCVDSLC